MSDDTGIYPEFFIEAAPDNAATEQEGRPMFRDVEKVRVHIAGDQKTVHTAKVTDLHRQRWKAQYEAFKAGQEAPINGTPLSEWPLLSVSRIKELQAQGIRTVEDLAELRDSALHSLGMGGRELQKQAQVFLDSAKDTAQATRLAKELSQRDDEIALLKSQLAEMNDVINGMKKPARKKAAA